MNEKSLTHQYSFLCDDMADGRGDWRKERERGEEGGNGEGVQLHPPPTLQNIFLY